MSEAKRYAVVVGVNDYSGSDILNLSFCAADADAFYDALLTYCEYDPMCVSLFSDSKHQDAKNPLRSDILAAVANMCSQATENDSILFFFAGHGTRDSKDSYLLTREFRTEIVAETSIPMNTINEYFRRSSARYKMRFFDACHSGRIGARGAPQSPDVQKHFLVEGEGSATFSACKEDQLAHEDAELGHGIFSYCLVKGLSGDAATDENNVTLHSLNMYTITKTSEITKKLGLIQTPVSDGYHVGNLVLAPVHSTLSTQVPPTLIKVQETSIEQIRPTPEKVPQIVADIRSLLEDEPEHQDYIAPSQKEKLTLGDKLVQQIYQHCRDLESLYHEQLQGLVTVTVERQSIQKCPLNLGLAEYIEASKIKQAVELELTYMTETVQTKQGLIPLPIYHTKEVLTGIREKHGYYESSIALKIRSQRPIQPACAMVIAVIPSTFGLYLLWYSCSTKLGPGQGEYWDQETFFMRALHAIPFTDKEGVQTLKELQDLFPQFVSFFSESCAARNAYTSKIGISGESLL